MKSKSSLKLPRGLTLAALFFTLLGGLARGQTTGSAMAAVLDSGTGIGWVDTDRTWPTVGAAEAHDGVDALRTPVVTPGNLEEIYGVVQGPGVFRGWVRVSSERWQDVLSVMVDGVRMAEYSGEEQHGFELPLPRGKHLVGFVWKKDESRNEGADAAWMDEVSFTPEVVADAEALDLAGGLVTVGTQGMTGYEFPWRGMPDAAGAHAGGDVLFAGVAGTSVLGVTAGGPVLVTFWTRLVASETGALGGTVTVEDAVGAPQEVDRVEMGGWTRWRVVMAEAGDAVRVVYTPGGLFRTSPDTAGCYLDDMSVEPLTVTTLAEALDAPGMSFTAGWSQSSLSLPDGEPWLAAVAPGLAHDGGDVVVSLPATRGKVRQYSTWPELKTTVTGPGRLKFWWRGSGSGRVSVVDAAGGAAAQPVYFIGSPVEWLDQELEIPAGSWVVTWSNIFSSPILLDGVRWTPTPPAAVPPTVAEALDFSGPVTLVRAGDWVPVGMSGAGFETDDAMTMALPGTGVASGAMAVTVAGPGWLTFAWKGDVQQALTLGIDGPVEVLRQSRVGRMTQPRTWQQVARWLPAGNHAVTWAADPEQNADWVGRGPLVVDAVEMSATAPSWVAALGGSGITKWELAQAPWTVVADETHDGISALRTPVTGAGMARSLVAHVAGPGTLRFWYKMGDPQPLEEGANEFRHPGAMFEGQLGDVDWREEVVQLAGSQDYDLTWAFLRSYRPTLPEDGVWIDEVSYEPATTTTVAEALDAPDFTWTVDGPLVALTGGGLVAAQGGDLLRLPKTPQAAASPVAWLTTTLPGPGVVRVRVNSIVNDWDAPKLWIDGQLSDGLPWTEGFTRAVAGAGTHQWAMAFPPGGADRDVDAFSFTPLPLVPLAEALDVAPELVGASVSGGARVLGLADAAESHDGVDVLRLEDDAGFSGVRAGVVVTGPARARFWWRAEGLGEASFRIAGQTVKQTGTFGWEEREIVTTSRLPEEMIIESKASESTAGTYRLWIDQVRIEALESVTLDEALHLPAGTVGTGGTGGVWQGLRPPGPPTTVPVIADGAFVAGWLNPGPPTPMWLDVHVTGPALLTATMDVPRSPGYVAEVTRFSDPSGPARTLAGNQPIYIPAGPQVVRWMVRHRSTNTATQSLPALTLRDLKIVPVSGDLAGALDAPGRSFTSTPAAEGGWYGAPKEGRDSTLFTDGSLLRLSGSATLETTLLTGPGLVSFEAEAPPLAGMEYSFIRGLTGQLVPADAVPPYSVSTVVYELIRYRPTTADARPVRQEIWVPAGDWRLVLTGSEPATLNHFTWTPQSAGDANLLARTGLDLEAGVAVSVPLAVGGAMAATESHDGVDALELRNERYSSLPLIEFPVTGPAVVSGWMKTGQNGRFNASLNEVRLLSAVTVADAAGWAPFRIVAPGSGPQVVGLGVESGLLGSVGTGIHYTLLLDEVAVTPLAPVTLAEALDTPGLMWTTAAGTGWVGGASAVASPDATDAAWVFVPAAATAPATDPPVWLEAAVTGPGTLRFQALQHVDGTDFIEVTLGSLPPFSLGGFRTATSSEWTSYLVSVPEGVSTVRLRPVASPYTAAVHGIDHVVWEPATAVPLAEALDLPAGAVVSTGGADAALWKGLAAPALAHDSTDLVLLRGDLTGASWLETTVAGPALVSWRERGVSGYVLSQTTLDGQPVREVTGSMGARQTAAVPAPGTPPDAAEENVWSRQEIIIGPGTHTLRWTVYLWPIGGFSEPLRPGEILLGLDEMTTRPLTPAPSLAQAVDQPGWTLTTNRPDRVFPMNGTATSHDGVDSVLMLGDVLATPEADQTRLTFSTPGPGVLTYRWRAVGGGFRMPPQALVTGGTYPDGVQAYTAPYGNEWEMGATLAPNPGANEITITISGKNYGFWLDEFVFTPGLPLAAAAGAPGLTWTQGGDAPWVGLPPWTYGGIELPARASVRVQDGQSAWLETVVTGPGRFAFQTDGYADFSVDGLELLQIGYQEDPVLVVPPGSHRLRWRAYGWQGFSIHEVTWVPSATVDPVAEALDAPDLPWLFTSADAAAAWQLQTTQTQVGGDALRATGVSLPYGAGVRTVLPYPGAISLRTRLDGGASFYYLPAATVPAGTWETRSLSYDAPGPVIVELKPLRPETHIAAAVVDLDEFRWQGQPVSLTEALDAPGQVWETSATLPFIGYAASSAEAVHDGVDAVMARNGEAGAWLQTTVTGPARVSWFEWASNGVVTVDGAPVASLPQSLAWRENQLELEPGLHTLRWTKTAAEAWGIDEFSVTPLAAGTTLAEVLDYAGTWFADPLSPWTPSTTDTHDGQDAALFTTTQNTARPATLGVTGPGRLEFWARSALSEAPYYENPTLLTGEPGYWSWRQPRQAGWRKYVVDSVPPGPHRLSWTTASNGSGSTTALDQVNYTPYAATTLAAAVDVGDAIRTGASDPWTGWLAGAGAVDDQDAAVSGGPGSWLSVPVPLGPGRFSFYARHPTDGDDSLGIEGLGGVRVPDQWKKFIYEVPADHVAAYTFIAQGDSAGFWLDAVQFTPAATLLQQWLAAHGLAAGADLNSDADGDGRPLLLDYAFGLAAHDHGARDVQAPADAGLPVFQLSSISGGGVLECRYLRRRTGSGLTYDVFFTDDLSTPLPIGPGAPPDQIVAVNDEWELVIVTDSARYGQSPSPRFGRVRVRLQLTGSP